ERRELTVTEVATLLGISAPTVIRLIRVGRLPASQACLGAPWITQQVDVDNYLVRRAADHPQSDNSNQLSIDLQ
ncbi:helix-turn-helix domain-containing protein, partial [Paraburkholderia sabiae]